MMMGITENQIRTEKNTTIGAKLSGMTLLYAAQPDSVSVALREILEKFGVSLLFASSVDEAESLFRMRCPEIVIVNKTLTGGGGIALSRKLRDAPSDAPCFLVLLLNDESESATLGEEISLFDDIVFPPFKELDLRNRLRTWERVVRLQQDLQAGLNRLASANALLVKANERMEKDLYTMAKIQTSLLPARLPVLEQVEFAWSYKPRSQLAGDGLNVFRLDEHNVACFVLDVSGTGTSAALLSVLLSRLLSPFPAQSTLLKELTEEPPGYRLRPPVEVLSELNRSFPLNLETNEYFTILYCIFNIHTGVLKYASAGHPMPIVLDKDGQIRTLTGSGIPIGFVEDAKFFGRQARLHPGDRMYLFSDGLLDAMSPERVPFSKGPMTEVLRESMKFPINEGVEHILTAAESWCGSAGPHDDISLLGLEFKKRLRTKSTSRTQHARHPTRVSSVWKRKHFCRRPSRNGCHI